MPTLDSQMVRLRRSTVERLRGYAARQALAAAQGSPRALQCDGEPGLEVCILELLRQVERHQQRAILSRRRRARRRRPRTAPLP